MKLSKGTILGLTLSLFAAAGPQLAHATSVDDRIELFNGRDLSAFHQLGDANWKIDGEAVTATSGNGFLVTKSSFENYHLELEFFAATGTNSGVFFRCDSAQKMTDRSCYEANIFDTRPDQTYRTGAITNLAAPKINLNTEDGSWHRYEIYAIGDRIRVILDSRETVFLRDHQHGSRPIALQFAGGGIKFRNVTVKKLEIGQGPSKSLIDGVWDLTSFDLIDPTGKSVPWCAGAYGVIIYTEEYMSVAINCTSDPKKILHYSGPFHLEGSTVVHSVRNFSDSAFSQIFRRSVMMPDKDHLQLSGPLSNGGQAVICWTRR